MTELPFQTTQEQIAKLPAIMDEMLLSGLAVPFTEKVIELASNDQGIFDLLEMWVEHRNEPLEREKDMQCIVELLWDNEL